MPPWKDNTWIDDDGSLTVGTEFDAEKMNNIELGIAEGLGGVAAASGMAGSALTKAAVAKEIAESTEQTAGSALVTGQQANIRAASGVTAAGSALVTAQQANARAASGVTAAGSALVTGQKAGALAASGVAAAGSGVTGVTNLFNMLAAAGMGVVFHGANASAKRPSGFEAVTWIGSVEPVNGAGHEEDVWINPEDFGINSSVFVPTCRAYKSGKQSIPNITLTALTLDSERWDNAGVHSTTTNTSRLTAPKDGIYSVVGSLGWEVEISGTSTTYFLAIRVNGTTIYGADWYPVAFQSEGTVSAQVKLAAGDYVELACYQQSGKAIETAGPAKSNFQNGVELAMTWMGTGTPSLTPVDWGLVTELPAGAGVGDTCQLKVREGEASPWKVWNCVKIESSGARPWAADGPPLYVPLTSEPESSSVTPVTAIEILAPVAMEADIEFGASLASAREAALSAGRLGVFKAASEVEWAAMGGSSIFDGAPLNRPTRTTLAKGEAALLKYFVEVAGKKVKFSRMFMSLKPVRVG